MKVMEPTQVCEAINDVGEPCCTKLAQFNVTGLYLCEEHAAIQRTSAQAFYSELRKDRTMDDLANAVDCKLCTSRPKAVGDNATPDDGYRRLICSNPCCDAHLPNAGYSTPYCHRVEGAIEIWNEKHEVAEQPPSVDYYYFTFNGYPVYAVPNGAFRAYASFPWVHPSTRDGSLSDEGLNWPSTPYLINKERFDSNESLWTCQVHLDGEFESTTLGQCERHVITFTPEGGF